MSTTPSLSDKFATAQQALTKVTAPSCLTLANLDDEDAHKHLDSLIDDLVVGRLCHSIEFSHDSFADNSMRHFYYRVTTDCYNPYIDQDEDGVYQDTGPVQEVVSVPVRLDMTLKDIAGAVADEVRGIANNCFANN